MTTEKLIAGCLFFVAAAEVFATVALIKAGLEVVAVQAAISALVVASCGAVFWRLRR